MASDEQATTLTGRYVLMPNPCTTEPCLPGMAPALESAGRHFFMTAGGRLLDKPAERWAWQPQYGDTIAVTGRTGQQVDIHGKAFATIEVESLTQIP